jgi:hypothetical protein
LIHPADKPDNDAYEQNPNGVLRTLPVARCCLRLLQGGLDLEQRHLLSL